MTHPREKELALLAGGDAGHWQRFTLDRHVRSCAECLAKVAEYRQLRETLAATDELPDLNWSLLEAEMRANIHLGFEAGQCVRGVRGEWAWNPGAWNPRLAVAVGCLLVLAGAGYFLGGPHPSASQTSRNATARTVPLYKVPVVAAEQEDAVLESSNSGLELRSGGGSLTLLSQRGVIAHQTVSAQGEIRARYVDGEAGTVTINNVYLQ